MMRVAYVCADPGVPVFGTKGCSIHVQEVLRVLLDRGATVDLFALRVGGDCPQDLASVRLHLMPKPNIGSGPVRERELLAVNGILQKMFADTVRLTSSTSDTLCGRTGDGVCETKNVAGILEVNAPLIEEQLLHRRLHSCRRHAGREACVSCGKSMVAVSSPVADYVAHFNVSRSRIEVVPNGVRVERFAFAHRLRETDVDARLPSAFWGRCAPGMAYPIWLKHFTRQKQEHSIMTCDYESWAMDHNGRYCRSKYNDCQIRHANRQSSLSAQFLTTVSRTSLPDLTSRLPPITPAQDCYFSPIKLFEYMAADYQWSPPTPAN